jgi:hypothetical protein
MKTVVLVIAAMTFPVSAGFCGAGMGVGVGYSRLFSIDTTAGEPPPVAATATSPYTGSGTTLLRGQLHCHSIPDDWAFYDYLGTGAASVVDKYQAMGYDFLALTDHNQVSPESVGWPGWAPNSVEITHGGLDLPDGHVLAVGTSEGTTIGDIDYESTWPFTADGIIVRVSKIHARGGLAFVAHPDSRPYDISLAALVSIVEQSSPQGIGVHTPGLYLGSAGTDAQGKWNRLLYAVGHPVFGYVEDDYHPDWFSDWKLGSTWLAVLGSSGEWWGAIKEKVRNGNTYCYWVEGGTWPSGKTPPQISVTASGGGNTPTISVTLSGTEEAPQGKTKWLEFIGYKWGFFQSLATYIPHDTTYTYPCNGREKFVRVLVTLPYSFGTLKIASQPIMINKSGYVTPYGAAGAAAMVAGSSPELRLRYLEPSERPSAMPAAGYIGDVFDVDTDDHQVPPGATLALSYDGEDTSAIGGTQYLAVYHYDTGSSAWVRVGGTVNPEGATVQTPITALGFYAISADLPPDTAAPQVFIDSPTSGATVSQDTTIKATVNDDLGAWRVSFYLNGHLLAEDAGALDFWRGDLRVTDYCEGNWTLRATAEDLAGNTGSAEIPIHIHSSTPRPTVSIASPANGATVSGVVTAAGTCWDDVAVASVAIKVGATLVGYAGISGSNWTCNVDTTYLADGLTTLTATVEDQPGNAASASIQVNLANGQAAGLSDLKSLADGTLAHLAEPPVVTAVFGDCVYVENDDRSCGILVSRPGHSVSVGMRVGVVGTPQTSPDGERYVAATSVYATGTGSVEPLMLNNRSAGGGQFGLQAGVVGGTGLNNIGLLLRTCGRVTQMGGGYLYVEDGSNLKDGTYTASVENLGLRVICDPTGYSEGDHLVVTGLSSCFLTPSGKIARRILTRGPEDAWRP